MKRICSLLMILNLSVLLCAQRPSYGKMSPLVRQAATEVTLKKRQARSVVGSSRRPTITAFVRITRNADAVFKANACKQLSKVGDIYIVSIPLDRLASLSHSPDVVRIEAGKSASVQMDTTIAMINALPVYDGTGIPEKYTGKGVIVGVQDIGFDLTHPNFYSADMSRYRIKAMWDQLSKDTIGSELPVGRDYKGQTELLAIGHPLDGLTQTHGTHTAGIAAGSGAKATA